MKRIIILCIMALSCYFVLGQEKLMLGPTYSDKPILIIIDGLSIPSPVIQQMNLNIQKSNIKKIVEDLKFKNDIYEGRVSIYTNLLFVYNGRLLTKSAEKWEMLQLINYEKIKIERIEKVEAKLLYGKKGKHGAIIIQDIHK